MWSRRWRKCSWSGRKQWGTENQWGPWSNLSTSSRCTLRRVSWCWYRLLASCPSSVTSPLYLRSVEVEGTHTQDPLRHPIVCLYDVCVGMRSPALVFLNYANYQHQIFSPTECWHALEIYTYSHIHNWLIIRPLGAPWTPIRVPCWWEWCSFCPRQ